jgi:hypothetical protein
MTTKLLPPTVVMMLMMMTKGWCVATTDAMHVSN